MTDFAATPQPGSDGRRSRESREDRLALAAAALARAEGRQGSPNDHGDPGEHGPPEWAVASDASVVTSDAPVVSSTRSPAARTAPQKRSRAGSSSAPENPWGPPPQEVTGRRARRGRHPGPPEDPEDSRTSGSPEKEAAQAESVARAIVLRQLSMAPRSRAQLEDKLRQRGCDDEVAATVLDRMTEVGLIDDAAYAEILVRNQMTSRGLAKTALKRELSRKGVDRDIADEALASVSPDAERARAEELVAKKLRTMHGLAPEVQARRLGGMLARKGYGGDIAWSVIREALDQAKEHQRD